MIAYLVRHGETAFNRDGLGLGRMDLPLTERGQLQGGTVALRLAAEPLSCVYSSPMSRAADIARSIAGERSIPVVYDDDLIELDVGVTEGLANADTRERFPAFYRDWLGPDPEFAQMPGGESLHDLALRVDRFLDRLRAAPDRPVAVVTHNFVLKVLLCRAVGLPVASFRGFTVDLASITTLMIGRERVQVVSVNDVCHLGPLEP